MKVLTDTILDDLTLRAAASPRRRANHNLHDSLEDGVQRFVNAVEPDSYIRPHRHVGGERWEMFLALKGQAAMLLFSEDGTVLERCEFAGSGPVRLVEIPPGVWHTVAVLTPATLLFEIKPGPYQPITDKDFAPWSPPEGATAAADFTRWLRQAAPGDASPFTTP